MTYVVFDGLFVIVEYSLVILAAGCGRVDTQGTQNT